MKCAKVGCNNDRHGGVLCNLCFGAEFPRVSAGMQGKAIPHDMVNEPPHYRGVSVKGTEVEAIDVIEALGLGYRLGTCLKYLWRAGKKGSRVEDLKKARWFLDREIAASESKE